LHQSHVVVGSAATLAVLTSTFMIVPINCFVTMRILSDALTAAGGPLLSENTAAVAKASVPTTATSRALGKSAVLQDLSTLAIFARLALVASIALLAISIPNFHLVVALIGAFSTMLISFILPTLIYVLVHRHTLRTTHALLCAALIAVGFVGMVVGVQNALVVD
jgi:hypothetical protein